MILSIVLKNRKANISIFSIIVNKLRYKIMSYPVTLFKIDKSFKISFYYTILTLSLVVYWRIKGSKKFLLDSKEIT